VHGVAARSDSACCLFYSAYQKMLRYTARANSDVFLSSLRASQPADSPMCPPHQRRTLKFGRAPQEMLILVMALYVHNFGADSFIRLTEFTLNYSAELAA
jgi:hypothetical protein